mmetsp:Transcript_24523/g.72676  ORF Transcript_24523/g.72676 Transcript_24523/m.72676 type:complete len:83 (+) Transcript_24523:168-416(+)|eukprot:190043-Chlamydomonas_euryale.AAC.5
MTRDFLLLLYGSYPTVSSSAIIDTQSPLHHLYGTSGMARATVERRLPACVASVSQLHAAASQADIERRLMSGKEQNCVSEFQ